MTSERTPESRPHVSERQRVPGFCLEVPVALSFTRFVAAHGGTESLRATGTGTGTDRPTEAASRNLLAFTLTFKRHVWLVSQAPG